ncbi:hypothetical protein [Frankia sp. CiP3]|uniref:hypothetical protein n=1 Tax=Frankia sp. CiP3 TaxID=2880971 RepID=UPI001EF665A9|nr:hypothetical protein [Frankia sp. CiP3]
MTDPSAFGLPVHVCTMLGKPGCGKSTLLWAINAQGQEGIGPFAFRAVDPDWELQLNEMWRDYVLKGVPMKGTKEKPIGFSMFGEENCVPRLVIDLEDFRGEAAYIAAPADDSDVARLRTRLKGSDSIYLCLDGEHVGAWLRDPRKPTVIDDGLGILTMRSHLVRAKADRKVRNLPTPRVVVLILKRDRLAESTGLSASDAYLKFVENAHLLFPDLFDAETDWVSMFSAVRIGAFDNDGHPDPGAIKPVNVLAGPLFCLYSHLMTTVGDQLAMVKTKEKESGNIEISIKRMSTNDLKKWWYRREISQKRTQAETNQAETYETRQDIARAQASLRRLESLVDLNVVIHKGKVYRLGDLS